MLVRMQAHLWHTSHSEILAIMHVPVWTVLSEAQNVEQHQNPVEVEGQCHEYMLDCKSGFMQLTLIIQYNLRVCVKTDFG